MGGAAHSFILEQKMFGVQESKLAVTKAITHETMLVNPLRVSIVSHVFRLRTGSLTQTQ